MKFPKVSKNLVFYILYVLIFSYILVKFFIGRNPIIQSNTLMYWILLTLSFILTTKYAKKMNIGLKGLIFIGFYYAFFILCEILDLLFGISVWNQTERTSNCYDWFEQYLAQGYDTDYKMDYTEALFDNDFDLSIKEATVNKYNYIFNELKLKPGMKLLDLGCGTGVWMTYCKERGVDVTGLTLSEEQAKIVRSKGFTNVYVQDYRILNENFLNQFDRITLFGSTEHNCSFTGIYNIFGYNENIDKCDNLRTDLYSLCKSYLKQNGMMYICTIVINDNYEFSNYDLMQGYIMERHYGGRYSRFGKYVKSIENADVEIVDIKDTTRDYHYCSIADPDYFGCWTVRWNENTGNKIVYLVKGITTDPFLLHHWLYYGFDTWQWQFGTTCGHKQPLTDEEIKNAPCLNKWYLCKV